MIWQSAILALLLMLTNRNTFLLDVVLLALLHLKSLISKICRPKVNRLAISSRQGLFSIIFYLVVVFSKVKSTIRFCSKIEYATLILIGKSIITSLARKPSIY